MLAGDAYVGKRSQAMLDGGGGARAGRGGGGGETAGACPDDVASRHLGDAVAAVVAAPGRVRASEELGVLGAAAVQGFGAVSERVAGPSPVDSTGR